MARSISTALTNAQKAVYGTPYVRIYLTSENGGTHKNYSHRLYELEHREEAYNDWATIILYNNDRAVSDVRGYWLEIGYGHDTSGHGGSGFEYKSTPRQWVKYQQTTSREGNLFTVLYCEGMWSAMRELDVITKGEPPNFDEEITDETVYGNVKDILNTIEFSGETFDLQALGTQDDGIVNDFTPKLYLNQVPFENPAEVLYRLMGMTKCYLRAKTNLDFEIRYPQEDDDVDETYYSHKGHYFFSYGEKENVIVPNHIVVYANAGQNDDWTEIVTAEAEDADSIALYHKVTKHHLAADITNQTDANNRAAAILTKVLAETLGGILVIPHDCRVELYDRVEVHDNRGT